MTEMVFTKFNLFFADGHSEAILVPYKSAEILKRFFDEIPSVKRSEGISRAPEEELRSAWRDELAPRAHLLPWPLAQHSPRWRRTTRA